MSLCLLLCHQRQVAVLYSLFPCLSSNINLTRNFLVVFNHSSCSLLRFVCTRFTSEVSPGSFAGREGTVRRIPSWSPAPLHLCPSELLLRLSVDTGPIFGGRTPQFFTPELSISYLSKDFKNLYSYQSSLIKILLRRLPPLLPLSFLLPEQPFVYIVSLPLDLLLHPYLSFLSRSPRPPRRHWTCPFRVCFLLGPLPRRLSLVTLPQSPLLLESHS